MAMSTAASNEHQRLTEATPDRVTNFMKNLLSQIYEHYDEQELIDVTFNLSNPTAMVTAHRLILSAASPYFRELFKNNEGPLIEITNIDSETFERLLTFCYTGNTLITMENVAEMLKAALILQLDNAVSDCVAFLMEHITEFTLQRAYVLENETQCDKLKDRLFEYEIENFMSIAQCAEFLQFDARKLKTIIEREDLNVENEKDVFDAIKRWYEHDALARKHQLADLISCLRLTQFDTNFLMTNIQYLPGCELITLKALSWINIPSTRSNISLRFTSVRGQLENSKDTSLFAFNVVGGQSRTIFQYNRTEDSWENLTDIPLNFMYFGVVLMDDNLIFTGGNQNGKAINEVSSWNLKTKTFATLPPMKEARQLHCVVILKGNIYAIGGLCGKNYLNSVEMYSESNGWQTINSLITPRWQASVVVLNEKIYVMGGWNKGALKSVECYDPATKCWTQCADMKEVRDCPSACVHNGQIYVVGGSNGTNSKTVERYDPQKNEWIEICSLAIFGQWVAYLLITSCGLLVDMKKIMKIMFPYTMNKIDNGSIKIHYLWMVVTIVLLYQKLCLNVKQKCIIHKINKDELSKYV